MRQVRNYDTPDPTAAVKSIAAVLVSQDIEQLSRGAYYLLTLHCGFIAHFNHEGFKAEYRDRLDDLVEFFLQGGEARLIDGLTGLPIDQWRNHLANPRSYLYDVSYRGVMLADIVRQLIELFRNYEARVRLVAEERRRSEKRAALFRLADELGYQVVERRAA